jgi:acyl-CoA synthetase (AMP-forming)/AMP-acid ligase II
MYQARFAPTLAEALEKPRRPSMRLIHVDDESGDDPLPGAVRCEELLASVSDEPLDLALSPDDLYVLYTGGTTGMPKAVLWRQHDIYLNAMGGRTLGTGERVGSARHLARYKLPKAVVFRDRLQRSPSGKADYWWAKAQAADGCGDCDH